MKDQKLLKEWRLEVTAMNGMVHHEMKELVPNNKEVKHWFDEYHKKIQEYIDTKIEQLKSGKPYNTNG